MTREKAFVCVLETLLFLLLCVLQERKKDWLSLREIMCVFRKCAPAWLCEREGGHLSVKRMMWCVCSRVVRQR